MKRVAFLIIAAALFYLVMFSIVKGDPLMGGGAAVALILLMIWGSRLHASDAADKVVKHVKQYNEQAKWSGAELIVKPRWFKRLCFALALLAVLLPCLNGALTFQLIGEGQWVCFYVSWVHRFCSGTRRGSRWLALCVKFRLATA